MRVGADTHVIELTEGWQWLTTIRRRMLESVRMVWTTSLLSTRCITNGERIGSHTIFGYLGVWSYFWGYLATSGAKSDVIFLLSDPKFLQRRRNFAFISLSFRYLTRDRQTNFRRQTRRPKQKVLMLKVRD